MALFGFSGIEMDKACMDMDWINGAVMYVRQELFVPRCVLTHLHVSTGVSDGVLFLGSCFFSAPIIVIFLLEFQCI